MTNVRWIGENLQIVSSLYHSRSSSSSRQQQAYVVHMQLHTFLHGINQVRKKKNQEMMIKQFPSLAIFVQFPIRICAISFFSSDRENPGLNTNTGWKKKRCCTYSRQQNKSLISPFNIFRNRVSKLRENKITGQLIEFHRQVD